MGYEPYADPVFYQETYKGNTIPEDDLEQALLQASRHVDWGRREIERSKQGQA